MRYAVVRKSVDKEEIVFEEDNITLCFGWIRKQLKTLDQDAGDDFRVIDRDFEKT